MKQSRGLGWKPLSGVSLQSKQNRFVRNLSIILIQIFLKWKHQDNMHATREKLVTFDQSMNPLTNTNMIWIYKDLYRIWIQKQGFQHNCCCSLNVNLTIMLCCHHPEERSIQVWITCFKLHKDVDNSVIITATGQCFSPSSITFLTITGPHRKTGYIPVNINTQEAIWCKKE